MMNLKDILSPKLTICNRSEETSKRQVLELISRLASDADDDIKYQNVLETLQRRERLGSTALGHGVAIPHSRIQDLKAPLCVLITLENAINFAADDTVAVDIIFGLLVPDNDDEEHLQILSQLTNKLRDKHFRESIRTAKTNDELYQTAIEKTDVTT